MKGHRLSGVILAIVAVAVPASGQSLSGSAAPIVASALRTADDVRRLSIDDAVQLALEQNVNIEVQRLNPQIQDLSTALARTAWTPTVTATVNNGSSNVPATSVFAGAADKLTRDQFTTGVGASQLLPWGASYNIRWDNGRWRSNSIFDTPNPSVSSTLSGTYVQPLLRNRLIDSARQQLLVSRTNREVSEIELKQTVLNTVRSVKVAYWDLAYATSSLAVQRQSLDLARESVRNTRSRLEAGMAAPIDLVEVESEVAQREEATIIAESAVAQAEDRLRALIFDPATTGVWNQKLELSDVASGQVRPIDTEAAVGRALANRTDLSSARKAIEVSDINIRYYQNQTLPDVRAQVDYGLSGLGGTALQFGQGFPPTVLGQQDIGYGSVLRKLLGSNFPTWTLSLSVAHPIGTSPAQASLARARLQRLQAQAEVKKVELKIATEVRDAGRQVNTNLKRVDATRAASRLAERRLEAEQKRLAAGMSTSFLVFQAQRDLAQARNAELRATLDYNTSLVDFETIQETPTSTGATIEFGDTK